MIARRSPKIREEREAERQRALRYLRWIWHVRKEATRD